MSEQREGFYEFGPYSVDAGRRRLLREGSPVQLKPKVFDTLLVLVLNSGRDMEKDELMQAVWPDTAVEENNLTQNISAIRKILGERRGEHRYVVTIPGRGYRFVAEVRRKERTEESALDSASGPRSLAVITSEVKEGTEAERGAELPSVEVSKPRTRRKLVRPVALLLLLLALLIGFAVAIPRLRRNTAAVVAADKPIESIAVLPFQALGSDSVDEFIGPGMADALITKLSNSRQLKVLSTGAVLRFNRPDQDPLAAGRELDVDSVLDGKFQRAGDRVRVTVQLVRVRDGASLWAETFDERFTDIFQMQDSISEQVTKALTVQLSREERERMLKRYTGNAEAYQAYLKGRYFLDKRTVESVKRAKEYFQEAVNRDQNYALAYAGLADCYHRFAQFGISAPLDAIPRATAAATKALELDDTLAEAHATLGIVNFRFLWDMERAEREFKRAFELDPRYAAAHMWYGFQLMSMDRFAEADVEMKRALELEPLSITMNNALADYYFELRQYDRALAQYRKTLEMDPSFLSAQVGIGRVYERKGMYREALEQFQAVQTKSESKNLPGAAAYTLAVAGRKEEARRMLARLLEQSVKSPGNPYLVAVIYAGLGEKMEALKWLEKAQSERALIPGPLRFDARLDALRTDERFKALLRRAGLPVENRLITPQT